MLRLTSSAFIQLQKIQETQAYKESTRNQDLKY